MKGRLPSGRTSIPVTSVSDSPSPKEEEGLALVWAWTWKIGLGFVAVGALIVASAALAAPVHALLIELGWSKGAPHAERLEGFLKVFRRLMVILLLAAGILFFRPWRHSLKSGDDYGLRGDRARLRPGLIGFASVVLCATAMLAWHFAEGWLQWEQPIRWGKAVGRFAKVLVTPAFLVAFFEEFFFRGWLHQRAQSKMPVLRAAVLVSLGYAFLHAFRPASQPLDVPLSTAGALEAFGSWFAYATDPSAFGPAFLGLFLLGMLLTAAYLRSRTLWAPIGIHMAGIWVIYSYGALTDRDPGRTWAGSKLLYDGPPGWILLAVAALLVWPRGRKPADGPSAA